MSCSLRGKLRKAARKTSAVAPLVLMNILYPKDEIHFVRLCLHHCRPPLSVIPSCPPPSFPHAPAVIPEIRNRESRNHSLTLPPYVKGFLLKGAMMSRGGLWGFGLEGVLPITLQQLIEDVCIPAYRGHQPLLQSIPRPSIFLRDKSPSLHQTTL